MRQTANAQRANVFPIEKRSVEMADILREHIGEYQQRYPLLPGQYKIVNNLLSCRTAVLGGHVEECDHCGTRRISYNSCRNRHCPKCQHMPRERWLEARKAELLPVSYFHNVFTLPHELNPIILFNKKIMLNILFKAVSQTLLAFGANPKNKLGGKLGFIAILHTWDQLLYAHFHLHCLIPGGVLRPDGSWHPCNRGYLFNVQALSLTFRGKFLEHMGKAYQAGKLKFPGISRPFEKPDRFAQLKNALYGKKWVVYMQKPIDRPEYVLDYLGRYTHRVAISNSRIMSLNDGAVAFKYKDRQNNQTLNATVTALEFIRRFLLHSLPKRFVRIRYFGFLSNRYKKNNVQKIRKFLGQSTADVETEKKSIEQMMLKLTGVDITKCPCCKKGTMRVVCEMSRPTYSYLNEVIRPPNLRKTA